MSKLNSDINFSKPGTLCEPIMMQEINSVVTINVNEVSGLVKREVDDYIASLPYSKITCITVQKAAELLQCFADTIRVYIRNGQIPASKLGKDYRIRITDLENFLLQNQTKAIVRRMQSKQKKVS